MKRQLTKEQLELIKIKVKAKREAGAGLRPLWTRNSIDKSKDYVLLLLENDKKLRDVELREVACANEPVEGSRCMYTTELIPIALVLSRNLDLIAKSVKLTNGEGFIFASDGPWMTETEFEEYKKGFD